jgi:hypothetical protein
MRPTAACALALVVVLSAAGCLGGGSELVRATGSPATFGSDAAAAAGYERVGVTNRTLNATLTTTVEGDSEGRTSKDVTATIPLALYRTAGDPPSVVAVASSPVVQLLENPPRSSDPLSTLSTAELVAFVQPTYGEVDTLERVDERAVTVLDEETTLVVYRGTTTAAGTALDVRVGVVRVRDAGDVVTVVAVGPGSTDRTDDVVSLLGSLEH